MSCGNNNTPSSQPISSGAVRLGNSATVAQGDYEQTTTTAIVVSQNNHNDHQAKEETIMSPNNNTLMYHYHHHHYLCCRQSKTEIPSKYYIMTYEICSVIPVTNGTEDHDNSSTLFVGHIVDVKSTAANNGGEEGRSCRGRVSKSFILRQRI